MKKESTDQCCRRLAHKKVKENYDGICVFYIISFLFSVKSLSKHLSPTSPLEKDYFKAPWKTSSPRRINVLVWIMAVGSLNCSETMQRKLPNTCSLPSVCPLCLENSDLLIHFSIFCPFSPNCWFSIFSMLKLVWVFDGSFSVNVLQLLRGPYL